MSTYVRSSISLCDNLYMWCHQQNYYDTGLDIKQKLSVKL